MKEIQVLAGDDIYEVFRKAWQVFCKLGQEEPVTFHHNARRVVIMPDDSHSETQILTYEEERKLVEKENEINEL